MRTLKSWLAAFAVIGLSPALLSSPATAQGTNELGVTDGWTLRQTPGVCSIGSWDGPRGPLLLGFSESPNEIMTSMWFGGGLFTVENGAPGQLALSEGSPISGQFEIKPGDKIVFRAMVKVAAVPQNDAGDRVFEYKLSSGDTVLDSSSFTVSARVWKQWRQCLGEQ